MPTLDELNEHPHCDMNYLKLTQFLSRWLCMKNGNHKEEMEFNREKHLVGDKNCIECWDGYPRPCKCGGLVHGSFGGEMEDGYYLIYICDKCGDEYNVGEID